MRLQQTPAACLAIMVTPLGTADVQGERIPASRLMLDWIGAARCAERTEAMMAERLSAEQRQSALRDLAGWSELSGREAIGKTFTFRDFSEAFGFMSRVALAAEKHDHHPEWRNVYKTVEIVLATHDADGVTQLDIDLARAMDRIAASMAGR